MPNASSAHEVPYAPEPRSHARIEAKKPVRVQTSELPAVLFDLDGTLIDSVYQHVQAWHETLRDAGIAIPIWKIHRRVGMSGKSFLG